ncbi:glycosyltransferase family 4 protein [Clostridium perfringens]|nr:glycosyltransferase family 4 protein [Clostridium perfringens]EHK2442950.1 glycosyltransferase family 4 protein [Clostridium perfringens]
MNVLFFHNTSPEYRIPLFEELSKRINVKFVFTRLEVNKKIYGNDVNSEKLSNINYISPKSGLSKYKEFYNEIRNHNVAVIVLPPLDSLGEYIEALYIFFISKAYKKKIIYFWEKWEAPKNKTPYLKRIKNFIQRIMCKPILKNIDYCVASGSRSYNYFLKLGISSKKLVICNDCSVVEKSLDDFNIREKYNIEKNKIIILYYGRIIKRKGLDKLINAHSNLSKEKELCLLIAGDGDFKSECEDLVKNLKLNNVIFTGSVHPKDRSIYFSQCDIFVLPSYFEKGVVEAWGLTVNEAMQFSKPVISTTAVGAAYDLIDGKNGIMVEENNVYKLEKAIKKVIDNEYSKKIKNNGNEIIGLYTYENMANQFIKAINIAFRNDYI